MAFETLGRLRVAPPSWPNHLILVIVQRRNSMKKRDSTFAPNIRPYRVTSTGR